MLSDRICKLRFTNVDLRGLEEIDKSTSDKMYFLILHLKIAKAFLCKMISIGFNIGV